VSIAGRPSIPSSPPEPMSLRALTRQALSGNEQDYTRSPLRRAVFLLALPMVMEMAIWLGFGPRGVFMSITAAYSLLAASAVVLFRAGRWKTQRV
jgi:hypothetical protein